MGALALEAEVVVPPDAFVPLGDAAADDAGGGAGALVAAAPPAGAENAEPGTHGARSLAGTLANIQSRNCVGVTPTVASIAA